MQVEFRGLRRYGRGQDAYYAIRLGRILQIKTVETVKHRITKTEPEPMLADCLHCRAS